MMRDDDGKAVALILAQLKPKGGRGEDVEAGEDAEAFPEDTLDGQLEAVATELVDAVKAGNTKAVADALRAAFAVCDAAPHVEGEHLEDEGEDEGPSHEILEAMGGGYSRGGRARYADGGEVGVPDGSNAASMAGRYAADKLTLGLSRAGEAAERRAAEAEDMMRLKREMNLGALDSGTAKQLEAEAMRRKFAKALGGR